MNLLFRNISAEFIKIKRSPILWLVLLLGISVSTLTFFKHVTNPYHEIGLNTNPWNGIYEFSLNILVLFMITLFVVLLVNFNTALEEQSNAWKYLYTLPFSKGYVYFSKLIVILLLLLISLIVYSICIYIAGHIIDIIVPEFEFYYYQPPFYQIFHSLIHIFIPMLGVVGIQYWLCMQHRHFLIPIGIGLLGFVFGLIIFISNHNIGYYFPYAYVMHANATFIKGANEFNPITFGGLGNLEWYSIGYFLIFTLLGFIQERSRNIK